MVRALVAEGHHVKVLDNNSRGAERRLDGIPGSVELVAGDVRDEETLVSAAREADAIVHLAFVNGTEFFYKQPDLVLDVGVRGMMNVLRACELHGIRDIVLASSSEVYQTPNVIPTPEDVPLVVPDVLNPRYSYGAGKLISESLLINFGRKRFERAVIFRPHNVYGPDMGWEHVIPQLTLEVLYAIDLHPKGPLPVPIQGDGSQTRAFMHVADCAEAVRLIIERGEHLGIYHVGNPEEITIAHLASRIASLLGRQTTLVAKEMPPGQTLRRCPDISRLRKLGFEPRVSLEKGLPETVDWYSAHRYERPSRTGQE